MLSPLRHNGFKCPLKFLSGFINASGAGGFYEPLRLRLFHRCSFAESFFLTSASFGLLRHSPSSVMSRSIGKPLAGDALQDMVRASGIVHAKCHAVIMPEIELGEIAV
jgi:hypothetical protein